MGVIVRKIKNTNTPTVIYKPTVEIPLQWADPQCSDVTQWCERIVYYVCVCVSVCGSL